MSYVLQSEANFAAAESDSFVAAYLVELEAQTLTLALALALALTLTPALARIGRRTPESTRRCC